MTSLISILLRQGVQFIPNDVSKLPITMMGFDTLEGGTLLVEDNIPSQLISALLMITPYARSAFTFKALNKESSPLIEMTCSMMAEFGVLVHHIHQGQLLVPVPQRYHARDYTVEPNLSLAAYFFAAAAVTGGELSIPPVQCAQSKQVSVKFLSVLEKMGCHVLETAHGLTLKGTSKLHGVEISMRDFSDTFMALACIAPFAQSPTRIAHIGPIKKQELNRMMAITSIFTKMGIHVETGSDWIKIFPGKPIGGMINPQHDPHLVMGLALLGLKTPGVTIENIECVNKIYPEFFILWNKLVENVSVKV
ncbi:MAG: hypothetical protein EPO11_01985 [Gammaproteobacteria bacterium]|nr:MAG: hypothetical protein EPO11_01985 [Gammaproteobacteria bacterium]